MLSYSNAITGEDPTYECIDFELCETVVELDDDEEGVTLTYICEEEDSNLYCTKDTDCEE